MKTGQHNDALSTQGEIQSTPRPRLPTVLRTLIVLVGGCGVLGWAAYVTWDQNRPARVTLRAMGSGNPSVRAELIRELEITGLGAARIVIPPLIAALRDADARVRVAAAITLGTIGADAAAGGEAEELRDATAALLGAMNDPDPAVGTAATTALGYVTGSKGAAELIDLRAVLAPLVESLADRNTDKRLAALRVLAIAGPAAGVEPPKEMAAALNDVSAGNRAAAVIALANFPRGLDPWIPSLLRMLERDENPVGLACASALERVRPPAVSPAIVPVLIAALGRPDQRVRAACCSLLMHFGPEARAAIPALIVLVRQQRGALASQDPWPWDPDRLAIQALSRIAGGTGSDRETVAVLTDIVRAEDPSRWAAAVEGLSELGPAASPAISELTRALRKSRGTPAPIPDAASLVRALGRIAPGTPSAGEAIAALTESLRDGPPRIRLLAADALAEFGSAATSAIPELIRLLRTTADMDPGDHIGSAAQALGRIALGTPSSDQAVAVLAEALHASSGGTRSAAIYALSRFRRHARIIVPRIRALQQDPDPAVRWAAEYALASLSKADDGQE
jgi:HEAT repeat protein